jgi:hypothetical protein
MYGSSGKISGNGASIIKSSFDANNQLTGFGKIRQEFGKSLTLKPEDVSEEKLQAQAQLTGELQGFNKLAALTSKQKLESAKALQQTHSIWWQHTQAALAQEQQWQNTAKQNLEGASEKLIAMSVGQNQHQGFSSYLSKADEMIDY